MAKVVAEYGEGPHKGPTFGMQLGKGHIELSQESTLEPRERKMKLEPLEVSCVHEEERFFGVRAVIDAHEFALPTRPNLHIQVMFPPKDVELLIILVFLVRLNIFKGVYLRSFSQKAIGGLTIE